MLKNKNCIIVGPANNLIGLGKGSFIDSFDIVIRLNDSYIISEERQKDYGNKCDILLHTCNCQMLCVMDRYRNYLNKCKLIINPTSKVHTQDYKITGNTVYQNYLKLGLNIPFYQVTGKYEKNMNYYGLNTGMCALDFLLNGTDLKSLYICGFSFHGFDNKEKYIINDKIKPYETYLFDSKEVYNCSCANEKPCKMRNDPEYSFLKTEQYQFEHFRKNIITHPTAIIDETITEIFSK